jgi:zinc transport system permease protein
MLDGIDVISSLRLVGVLLISSLIVIPNITAITFGKGFKKTVLISIMIAVSSVLGGILISYVMNLAPGGTIVIFSIAILLDSIGAKPILKKNETRSLTKAT